MSCIICGDEAVIAVEDKFICHKHLSLIKSIYENLIDEWNTKICSMFNFIELDNPPLKDCKCGYTRAIPFHYYINDNGNLILCCVCKNCSGYKEVSDSFNFPIKFGTIPSYSGIDTVLSSGKKHPDFYG